MRKSQIQQSRRTLLKSSSKEISTFISSIINCLAKHLDIHKGVLKPVLLEQKTHLDMGLRDAYA